MVGKDIIFQIYKFFPSSNLQVVPIPHYSCYYYLNPSIQITFVCLQLDVVASSTKRGKKGSANFMHNKFRIQ